MITSKRYDRQTSLPQIGQSGQQKLNSATVMIVGAGGLGCPAAQYLSASGVGRIIIVDYDSIEESNLNRQVLFNPSDIGRFKAEVAAEKLSRFNPEIKITAIPEALSESIAQNYLPECDVVLDCTDRPDSRYLINDLCIKYNKPFVYAGVYRFEGQLAVFNYEGGATYRCAFPEPNNPTFAPSCEDNGVLGTIPGVLGIMQANEVIKILALKNEVNSGYLLIINFLNNNRRTIYLKRKTKNGALPKPRNIMNELTPEELKQRLEKGEEFIFVDVREPFEEQAPSALQGHNLPTSNWNPDKLIALLESGQPAIIYCQHGARSRMVIDSMPIDIQKQLINLRGGVAAWNQEIPA